MKSSGIFADGRTCVGVTAADIKTIGCKIYNKNRGLKRGNDYAD
jgi:hypothetical protein